jgi:hypothetical protein
MTKKKQIETVQELVARTPLKTPLQGKDLNYMLELFKRHPWYESKAGAGIESVQVFENSNYGHKPSRGFWIERVDGTWTDISWRECISPTGQPKRVKNALRHLITEQVHDFRTSMVDKVGNCSITLETLFNHELEVDHEPPFTFEALVKDFLLVSNLDFEEVEVRPPGDGELNDMLVSEDLAEKWKEYHKETAKLRLIKKELNR